MRRLGATWFWKWKHPLLVGGTYPCLCNWGNSSLIWTTVAISPERWEEHRAPLSSHLLTGSEWRKLNLSYSEGSASRPLRHFTGCFPLLCNSEPASASHQTGRPFQSYHLHAQELSCVGELSLGHLSGMPEEGMWHLSVAGAHGQWCVWHVHVRDQNPWVPLLMDAVPSALPKPSTMFFPLSTWIPTASFLWRALSTQRVARGRQSPKSADEPELGCLGEKFTWEMLQDVNHPEKIPCLISAASGASLHDEFSPGGLCSQHRNRLHFDRRSHSSLSPYTSPIWGFTLIYR